MTGTLIDVNEFNYQNEIELGVYKPILIFKDGEYFLNIDTATFLIICVLLGTLMFRTVFFVISSSFKLGFSIISHKKLGKD